MNRADRATVHLVCNAHIDPVWLWEWPEGAGEALSTFRTAAELCETRPGFVFSHNESVLYEWLEAYEPDLFGRIRALVRKDRWAILGGWYVQPDCNMPSGESFVRQILLGRRYFRKKFGVDVRTAANLDPFGHSRGLVQILAKSGYDSYLFCRPDAKFARLPAEDFIWIGFDGSRVFASRAGAHYNSREGGARSKVETWISRNPGREPSLLLWGVGDHGGGASKRDLDDLDALRAERKDVRIVHSTAAAYFRELRAGGRKLPRHDRDLNPWAVGCYTSMARVKRAHRRLENDLFTAEKMSAAAAFQGLMRYPAQELAQAQRDLALAEFHDILPGSSIGPGEEGALRLLGHGLEICSRAQTAAFFALAGGEPPPAEGEIPIFVYNPHPFRIRTAVECELQAHEPNFDGGYRLPQVFQNGSLLPCQPEKELSNLALEWRKKVVFLADLEPGRLNRFACRLKKTAARPAPPSLEEGDFLRFRSPDLEVDVGARTGLVERCRMHGKRVLRPGAFRPMVMADSADPWGMSVVRFRDEAGAFRLASPKECASLSGVDRDALAPVRVIEDGVVRTVIESCLVYRGSAVVLRYLLPRRGTEIGVEARVLWNEKDRMLKLSVPTALRDGGYLGQTAYGRGPLPSNGDETVAQRWTAVTSPALRLALTCINDATYGSDFRDGELRLSLLRSPAHSADPAPGRPLVYQDRFIPRIDQGERVFRFWINAGPARERLDAVEREALARNETPFALCYFPPGTGRAARPFVALSGASIVITALKKAEGSSALVIRLFEPTGRRRGTTLTLPFAGARIRFAMRPFEIKTLLYRPRTKTFSETDLLERPLIKE